MDEFSNIYKASIAVFHGIIAVWLFSTFSETSIEEFQFLILLVFFAVANLLIWSGIRLIWEREWRPFDDLSVIRYQPSDVIGLTIVAIVVGLVAAWVHRTDVVLRVANQIPFVDWEREGTSEPLNELFRRLLADRLNDVDNRNEALLVHRNNQPPYIRIWLVDSKGGYEGHLSFAPTKSESREIVLNPACRIVQDDGLPLKVKSTELIEGFGVFLPLADVTAIEVLERSRSPCAKIIEDMKSAFEANSRRSP